MKCEDTKELIHAYADRELDLIKSLEVERHLSECDACSKTVASLQALRSVVSGVYQKPSARLEGRVISAIRKAEKREAPARLLSWRWVGVAASFALLMVVSWGLFRVLSGPPPDEALAREVVSSHVRSLMASHLAEIWRASAQSATSQVNIRNKPTNDM